MAQVKITLVRSLSGRKPRQIQVCQALGLKKVNDYTIQTDSAATRGQIAKVVHLVEVEEVEGA
ncbi:MAG: 50S ribosomal protein L30 [Eubacteriales bacterium]|nr:50S ribosomal protein L30 [Eubacteriales bacterium]